MQPSMRWQCALYCACQVAWSPHCLCLVFVKLRRGVWTLYHLESFEMGLKMSDAMDTEMIEESLVVIDQACKKFKKTVFLRATKEMDWQARHRADDVLVCFDAVRYAGHRRHKDLLLLELEQLCQKLEHTMDWSQVNRPFDWGGYELVLDSVSLAQGAIYSALGVYKPCRALMPLLAGQRI